MSLFLKENDIDILTLSETWLIVTVTDLRYFVGSKLSGSLVHKKNFILT